MMEQKSSLSNHSSHISSISSKLAKKGFGTPLMVQQYEKSVQVEEDNLGKESVHINEWKCCRSCGQVFEEFCQKTTLHGLRYVGDKSEGLLPRLFWVVAFILAVLTAGYYINAVYEKWVENPVIVSIGARATRMREIPFPAITICTMNEARKSKAEKINNSTNPQDEIFKEMLGDLCSNSDYAPLINVTSENNPEHWNALLAFMTKMRQPCHEMIEACYFAGENYTCEDIFNPTLSDEGICCSFNKVKRDLIYRDPRDLSDLNITFMKKVVDWTPENGYPPNTPSGTLPWRPRGSGAHLGLTLVLNAEVDEYYCSTSASKGFKMLVHSPVEAPKIADFGALIASGREYRIKIRPTIMHASKSLHYVNEEQRQCVFSGEQYLKFYRTYTQRNCILECETNYTLAICGCVPYYLPKNSTTPICGREEEGCTTNAKKLVEMFLVNDHAENKYRWPKPVCKCLPGCSEINYQTSSTYGNLEPEYLEDKGYNIKTIFKTASRQKRNLAVIHLYFTETQFLNYYKTELIGFSEFLSSTGGLLGLFLGFSVISAVEVMYFLTVRLCSTLFKKRNTTEHVSPKMHKQKNTYPFIQ